MSGLSNALFSGGARAYGTGADTFVVRRAFLGRAAVCIAGAVVFFLAPGGSAFRFGRRYGLNIGLAP